MTAASRPPALTQSIGNLIVETRGEGLIEITARVSGWLRHERCLDGLLTLFLRHTSASLTIQENADPAVQKDLVTAMRRIAPEDAEWIHSTEGSDDMPAHVKSLLTGVNLSVPVHRGQLMLGTWQGIYVFEHRARGHRREVALHFMGTGTGGQDSET